MVFILRGESKYMRFNRLFISLALCATSMAQAQSAYQPQPVRPPAGSGYLLPDGTVRVIGSPDMVGVMAKLDALYTQTHPGTKIVYQTGNNDAAIYSLEFDATPLAPITTYFGGSLTYADIARGPALSIRIAHASLAPAAKVSPLAIIVNPANPIANLSLAKAASIFTQQMRQPVFATWAQAGIKTELGAQAIVPCGLPWSDHYASEDTAFAEDIFFRKFGGQPPVNTYRFFSTYDDVVRFVAQTPAAIGIVELNHVTTGVKVVGVTETPLGRPQTGTQEQIDAGHYPLDRFLYINLHVTSGKPLDAFVQEYMRLVLSPEGQQAIAGSGEGYMPLNAAELDAERAKLE